MGAIGGAQAGLWGPPKRWASAKAPAPSANGLEARAGKPPAAGGVGIAKVPDAPAAAAAAEMPLVRSAGFVFKGVSRVLITPGSR